jgi:hypothetical protein
MLGCARAWQVDFQTRARERERGEEFLRIDRIGKRAEQSQASESAFEKLQP